MTKKTDSREPTAISRGIFLIAICLLLMFWRVPGFVDDIDLFVNGETVAAVIETKTAARQRQGKRAVYFFYFLANSDTIRNESDMFEPLMAMTSTRNENFENVFKVVYDPSDLVANYPRATLRVHFFISLLILLFALTLGASGAMLFKEHFSS
ncbi:MAG: hypothetical protein Roseis3KO_45670 [Roseivirga sp.]